MKALVVNADDFGLSHGVNRGIIRAHLDGIVTSTSLMVDGMAAKEGRKLCKLKNLSVGLHFQISDKKLESDLRSGIKIKNNAIKKVKDEFGRQLNEFQKIIGKKPIHLDSHHNIHLHPVLLRIFKNYSQKESITFRGSEKTNLIANFYGRGIGSVSIPNRIASDYLITILSNLEDGVNELMCHPGLIDDGLKKMSGYSNERERELKTLTDPNVINCIENLGIRLTNWDTIDSSKMAVL